MNPNAPEHQPDVARDVAVVRWASDKMFSDAHPVIAEMLNKRVTALNNLQILRESIEEQNQRSGHSIPKPEFPLFCITPPEKSNVYTGVRISSKNGLYTLDIDNGTPSKCTQVYLEFICDYANRWHSLLSGTDYHSPGTDPKFFCFTQNFHTRLMERKPDGMAKETAKRLSASQFWKLRYLFIPVNFYPLGQNSLHVALCAISPEARTVDYLCCGGDTGMPISPQPDGSKIVPAIFLWLAYFLQDDFLPFEWRLRNDAGHMQRNLGGDCGVYTVTTAMSLAFGYHLGAFPEGHQARALFRRRTYVQDLMFEGFEFWNKDPNSPNWQYYPLLDTKPTASKNEKFFELPKQLIDELPHHVAVRRKCYVECPNKSLLKVHCKRNMRFYPGYEAAKVSGPLATLREFISWVEEMDHMRHTRQYRRGCRPLPYPKFQPEKWIDPRIESRHAIPPRALWPSQPTYSLLLPSKKHSPPITSEDRKAQNR